MRFLTRVFILLSFGCISLLWFLWRHTPLIQDSLSMKEERANSALIFDTLLHVQQLRKKMLRSFCNKHGKTNQLPHTQQKASQTLSSMMVNNKLHFLYCKIPGTGVEDWEKLLEMLVEREDVTLHMPVPYQRQFGTSKMLSHYNVTSMEAMMKSYTKVIFIREPFQRLIYAYMHGLAEGLTFQEFIQYILEGGSMNASVEWTPLVSLCHPCIILYDYIVVFGLLGSEVHHLMLRAGLPESIQVPEFIDSKIRWTYSWLEDQMFKELSLEQKKQLCRFFRFDFAAFSFPHSLLWDLTCISESN
uniref:Carbohydrate sulfotransferase n=1 Tax=Anolis carolinensis TaxID=28377 RepID=A0A803TPU4_ANOCA|nr:PREDICTED: carbohydrate sulfotransferase 9-like [Anolis carolinensis]|eukprot:XP_003216110.1 PREDICTED: carbohydrate sulfotransferase 9-like [Anolis carolinensis]